MKAKFITSILFLLCALINRSFAQSDIAAPGSGHTGGANTGYYVGWDNTTTFPLNIKQDETSSPQNIQFWTNGTQKMTLIGSSGSTDGFLGIATTSPSFVLDIDGNATTTTTGDVFRTNGKSTAATYWKMRRGGTDYGILYNNIDNHFYIEAANGSGDLRFQTGGANTRMTILGSGNPGFVGIGTTSPTAALYINGNNLATGDVVKTQAASGTHSYWKMYGTLSNSAVEFGALFRLHETYDFRIQASHANGGLHFNTGGGNLRMIITKDGDVGIGGTITEPAQRVEIYKAGIQLRLSYTIGSAYSDFETTSVGNLILAPSAGRVGIGLTSGSTFHGSRLEVLHDADNATPLWSSTAGSNATAIKGEATGEDGTALFAEGYSYGVFATAGGTPKDGGSPMAAVSGIADGSINTGTGHSSNVGVFGAVYESNESAPAENRAVFGLAIADASENPDNPTTNIGIFGEASGGTTDHNWAGYFNGNLYAVTYENIPSDAALKTDIQDFSDALTKISQLHPVTFSYLTADYPQMNLPEGIQIGFIAQEVENTFPEVTSDIPVSAVFDSAGNQTSPAFTIKGYKPAELIPVAIQGIKELKSIIDQQQQQINDMQEQLNGCCGLGMRSSASNGSNNNEVMDQTIELKSLQAPFLGQSVPNPHSTQATIPYYIPATEIGEAKIIFLDNLGREVNTIDILGRGQGQLTVMTSQLEDGIYSYSLIIDGKVIDTKKMVKQH